MQVYEEMTPQEVKAEQEKVLGTVRKAGVSLTAVQAVVCFILLLAALLLKYMLPQLYGEVRAWYDEELQRSVLITYDDVSAL